MTNNNGHKKLYSNAMEPREKNNRNKTKYYVIELKLNALIYIILHTHGK